MDWAKVISVLGIVATLISSTGFYISWDGRKGDTQEKKGLKIVLAHKAKCKGGP